MAANDWSTCRLEAESLTCRIGKLRDGESDMDDIDRKLLHLLQEDATFSIAQLADLVGLSPTPCWKRIQKLEMRGVITRRVAVVDPDRVGAGLSVFVAVEAGEHTPEWLERFSSAVTAMPEVIEVYRMAGDVDYMLHIAVADTAEYDAFYKRLIAAAAMKNVTSRFAMERIKHTTAYPLHPAVFRDRRVIDSSDEEQVLLGTSNMEDKFALKTAE
jgi:Lrp/AsnC family transcriptional regulator